MSGGEVINLRLARKRRARAEAEADASSNRAAFGRSKAARAQDRAETARRDRSLDGAQLTSDSGAAPSAGPPQR